MDVRAHPRTGKCRLIEHCARVRLALCRSHAADGDDEATATSGDIDRVAFFLFGWCVQ